METPKTYVGYDKDNNQIASCQANDANEIVNPETVQAAIKAVEQAAESGTQDIVSALQNIESDAGDAVIVQGTNMINAINEVCSAVKSIAGSIGNSVSSVYDEALRIHDEIQIKYNSQAEEVVRSAEGVVRVSG